MSMLGLWGGAIALALAAVVVAAISRLMARPQVPVRQLKTRGSLGEVRRVPSSLAAELTYPLLHADNTITEDGEFSAGSRPSPGQTFGLYGATGLYCTGNHVPNEPPTSPPLRASVAAGSPFSPRRQLAEAEGVWVDGMQAFVVTDPAPPFAIVTASRDWLQFCGFSASEVKGRTLRLLQGPATERLLAAKLVEAAQLGVSTDAVLTNYTKHCLPFRNHIHVHPYDDRNGVLAGFKVVTDRAEVLGSSPARPLQMWSDRSATATANDEAEDEGSAILHALQALVEASDGEGLDMHSAGLPSLERRTPASPRRGAGGQKESVISRHSPKRAMSVPGSPFGADKSPFAPSRNGVIRSPKRSTQLDEMQGPAEPLSLPPAAMAAEPSRPAHAAQPRAFKRRSACGSTPIGMLGALAPSLTGAQNQKRAALPRA